MKDNSAREPGKSTPTKGELEVLQVLWQQGPLTVREVHEILNSRREAVQYTSTLKLMQVMAEKGMLTRDMSSMKHIYTAALEEKKIKNKLLTGFVDTIYGGSVTDMMMGLLNAGNTTEKEMNAIKEMLRKLEDKK